MEEDSPCQACGAVAPHLCAKCETVPYCSAACVASDWPKHKLECRNLRLKHAVHDLMRREIAWLQNLPDNAKLDLVSIASPGPVTNFKYHHHLYFVSFALVLAGVLPCHYHDTTEGHYWDSYTEQFTEHVLCPWFAEHERLLKKKGFRLVSFESPREFCVCGDLPRQNVEGCECMIKLKVGPLFWNKQHPEADVVKQAFFPPHPQESDMNVCSAEGAKEDCYPFETYRILGLCASNHTWQFREMSAIYYIHDPVALLKDNEVCCSVCMWRALNCVTAGKAGEFFAVCEEALSKFDISIDMVPPGLSEMGAEYNLPAEGYARLVLGAARGDGTRAIEFFNSLYKSALSNRKIKATGRLIRQYAQQG